jgi:hypothetical protein
MERIFLKSGGKSISGGAQLPHRREACPDGQILPIPVGFCLLLFGAYDPSNCLICTHSLLSLVYGKFLFHALLYYYSQACIIIVRLGHLSIGNRDECICKINGLGLLFRGNLRWDCRLREELPSSSKIRNVGDDLFDLKSQVAPLMPFPPPFLTLR